MSAYADSETLVWRDAGAMLQTLALVAELFGLGFCPLGILGSEVVSALPSGGSFLLPVLRQSDCQLKADRHGIN